MFTLFPFPLGKGKGVSTHLVLIFGFALVLFSPIEFKGSEGVLPWTAYLLLLGFLYLNLCVPVPVRAHLFLYFTLVL